MGSKGLAGSLIFKSEFQILEYFQEKFIIQMLFVCLSRFYTYYAKVFLHKLKMLFHIILLNILSQKSNFRKL
jgi:hypothetical protein